MDAAVTIGFVTEKPYGYSALRLDTSEADKQLFTSQAKAVVEALDEKQRRFIFTH